MIKGLPTATRRDDPRNAKIAPYAISFRLLIYKKLRSRPGTEEGGFKKTKPVRDASTTIHRSHAPAGRGNDEDALSGSKAPAHLVLARNQPGQIQTGDGAILDRPMPRDHHAIGSVGGTVHNRCKRIAITGEAQFVELE
jgi:hypothetical protein